MRILRAPIIAGIGLALVLVASACDVPAASTPAPAPSQTVAPPAATAVPTQAAATPTKASATPTVAPATPTSAVPAPTKAAASSAPAGNVSLEDLSARAKTNTQYSYDMVATIMGQDITATIYVKGPLVRQEIDFGGQKGVMIADQSKKMAYTMEGGQNVAIRHEITDSSDQVNPNDALQSFPKDTRITGTDTIDGKSAVILDVPDPQQPSKIWIWTEKGLILRAEATAIPGLVSMDFRNYKFDPLPDSLFQIPAGIQIVDEPVAPPDLSGTGPAPGR